jgi:hypothetical protein
MPAALLQRSGQRSLMPMMVSPSWSAKSLKSFTFSVASGRLRTRQQAAIQVSFTGRGRPRRSRTLGRVEQPGQHRQVVVAAGEPRYRRWELGQGGRRRRRGAGIVQPGWRVQDFVRAPVYDALQPPDLQVGHVIVQL